MENDNHSTDGDSSLHHDISNNNKEKKIRENHKKHEEEFDRSQDAKDKKMINAFF